MGYMKKVLLSFALLSVLMLGGCKDEENKKLGTLSAPQQITVQSDEGKSLIIFDEVQNAQYYHIYINDMSVTVKGDGLGSIEFDASKIITLPQKYQIKVKASAGKYFDSRFSSVYEYSHTGTLATPTLSIDNTTLNWNKVANADFYDILVTSYNPTVEEVYRSPVNTFDFANLLTNVGEYSFKVCAISEDATYLPSTYSNVERYTKTKTLVNPHDLVSEYNADTGETLLYFVADEEAQSFVVNINGVNYNLNSNLLVPQDLQNVYCIKLGSLAKQHSIPFDCANNISVSVKALTSAPYVNASNFSNTITCGITATLPTPTLSTTPGATTCNVKILYNSKPYSDNTYLSGFAFYLDDKIIKTVGKDMVDIDLPINMITSGGLRVQAISNNNNCHSSDLSNVKYIDTSLASLGAVNATYNNGVLSWHAVENATKYIVQISNKEFRYATTISSVATLQVNLSEICEPSKYNVSIIAMADNYQQAEMSLQVSYSIKLETPVNIDIKTEADITYLYFDEVDDADGYVIYTTRENEKGQKETVKETELFKASPIALNRYISDAVSYDISVQAVCLSNVYVFDSDKSGDVALETVKTLTKPTLTITNEDSRYYLNIEVKASEASITKGCEIWINYASYGIQTLENGKAKIDITTYFATAGVYNFKAKALANDENEYIKDSVMSSISKTIKKQLDVVQNITVKELADESKYILEFDEQTLAAKYLVNIVKAEDSGFNVEFEINSGYADITQYVTENGVYKVYVKAIALQDGYYEDSATSGNPARLVKGYTLPIVKNIAVNKSGEKIIATWSAVANSSSYQVAIYYTSPTGDKVLKKILDTKTNSIELASDIVAKEGDYGVQVKAIGDGELYETGQVGVYSYKHVMETIYDFNRNTVFMYGNDYQYQITDLNDFKHLLWYHYLYNNEVWDYDNSLEYNLKVYCSADLETLAKNYSASLAEEVKGMENVDIMKHIATKFLSEYPEIASYTVDANNQITCFNEKTNLYLFRYESKLKEDKLDAITTTDKVFEGKVDEVSDFDKRSTNYVFNIDKLASVDVTTSEQLFMAVQYHKRPNFVGNSKVAEAIYENAKFLLRQICSDKMSDYEKVVQIFDLLNNRVAYNSTVSAGDAYEDLGGGILRGNIKDFYLEGVLYNTKSTSGLFTSMEDFKGLSATSEGLAKAFTLLCEIEGVDSIKVKGTIGEGNENSWNKVYLDLDGVEGKEWYALDLASSRVETEINSQNIQVATHNYFLVTDIYLNTELTAQISSWHSGLGAESAQVSYKAETSYDYYEKDIIKANYIAKYITTAPDGQPQINISNKSIAEDHKATKESEFTPLIVATHINSNNMHNIILEIDVTGTNSNIETLKKNMASAYISNASTFLKGEGLEGQYEGSFTITSKGNIIVLCFVPM